MWPRPLLARVLAVMGWISFGFLAFLIFTSNPFERLLPGEFRSLLPLFIGSMAGLFVIGDSTFNSLAVGSIIVVAVAAPPRNGRP